MATLFLLAATDIAHECRQFSKIDSERGANNDNLKLIIAENVQQRLARTGQFMNAEGSSQEPASEVEAGKASTEPENAVSQQNHCTLDLEIGHQHSSKRNVQLEIYSPQYNRILRLNLF